MKVLLCTVLLLAGTGGVAADIAIERPDIRWLFGGFGFQNAEARLTPLMTDEFRDERALKCFRELAPSFSRVYALAPTNLLYYSHLPTGTAEERN